MKNKAWKWIIKNGKKSFPAIALLTGLSVVMSLIQVKFATASKDVIDVATKTTEGVFSSVFLVLIALLLIRLVLQIFGNYLNVHSASKFEIALKRHIFNTLIGKDYLSVSKFHSGELLNRINSDVSVIVGGIISILPSAALFLTSIIGAFFVLYNIDSVLAIIILCIGPVVAVGARIYSSKYKVMHKNVRNMTEKPNHLCWRFCRIFWL